MCDYDDLSEVGVMLCELWVIKGECTLVCVYVWVNLLVVVFGWVICKYVNVSEGMSMCICVNLFICESKYMNLYIGEYVRILILENCYRCLCV